MEDNVEPINNEHDMEQAETLDMLMNMGPQHPSTHGVLRLVLTCGGKPRLEQVEGRSRRTLDGERFAGVIASQVGDGTTTDSPANAFG